MWRQSIHRLPYFFIWFHRLEVHDVFLFGIFTRSFTNVILVVFMPFVAADAQQKAPWKSIPLLFGTHLDPSPTSAGWISYFNATRVPGRCSPPHSGSALDPRVSVDTPFMPEVQTPDPTLEVFRGAISKQWCRHIFPFSNAADNQLIARQTLWHVKWVPCMPARNIDPVSPLL